MCDQREQLLGFLGQALMHDDQFYFSSFRVLCGDWSSIDNNRWNEGVKQLPKDRMPGNKVQLQSN